MTRSRETTGAVSRSSGRLATPALQEGNVRPVMQTVTVSVYALERKIWFYDSVLGFEQDGYYDQTRWKSYHTEERASFAIIEDPDRGPKVSSDIINFDVNGLEGVWHSTRRKADVGLPLQETPRGSLKSTVRGPDGSGVGFVAVQ
jgi:hypothetical protein